MNIMLLAKHPPSVGFCYDEDLKKTRASGRNVGKVFNPVVKLVLENQPFLMPEPAEKPSPHSVLGYVHLY